MDLIQVTSVPIIVAVVYVALYVYKQVVKQEKFICIIPIIAALLGAVLGITAFYCLPDIIAAVNVLAAILIGAASGLAATGANQIFKQLTKKED